MKKLIPVFLILVLAVACKDECKDEFCPTGYECVDGVCEAADGNCPIGYEGDDCTTPQNSKFAGDYNTDYSGTGGLSASNGTTIASVATVSGKPDKIRINVELDVTASVLGQSIDLPLAVDVEATVEGDTYYVPSTTIDTEVQGFPISINFQVDGDKVSESGLNSTLTMTGFLTGTVVMTGTK